MAKTSGGSRNQKKSHPAPVQMALPGMAPVHSQNGVLIRHLKGIEDDPAYFNRTTERMYVFNPDGSLDYTLSQHQESSISLNTAQRGRLNGKILVHNHPSGGTFSNNDVLMAAQYDLAEVRATGYRGTFIMRKPSKGWPPRAELANLYFASQFSIPASEGMWAQFSKDIGADYVFVKRQLY